ncbi:hypothetical protein SDC9_52570 [bioreactor metagenome]|uniref:BioF2-like acetyltransferase domain-containing protein n=1 Tax=bioreactor metagenome TaxID=1076179 RepID=A0A644WRY5_9ZZZZ
MSAWNDILRENGNTNPYVTTDWILGWWGFFGGGREMCILMLSDGSEAVGFCPLMRIKKLFCEEIRFIGYPQASRMNLIVRHGYEREFSCRVARFLTSMEGAVICTLHGLNREDECYSFLRQALGFSLCSVQTQQSSVIDLKSGSEEEFFQARRHHYRIKKTMSREKALSKLCCLTFEKASPEELEIIFQLHQKRWQKKIDQNGFGKGISKEFFSWLTASGRSPFWNVAVYLLKAGKHPIGFAYGIECGRRFTFYRIAHDDDFAFFKPGMIVTKKILEQCFKSGCEKFDFSTGDEEYKKSWTDDVELIDKISFGTERPAVKLLILMDRFTNSVRHTLKKNAAIVRFKRVTAGRMRYFFSLAHWITLMRRLGNTIRLRGWRELFFILMPSHTAAHVRYTAGSSETAPLDCAVSLRTVSLEEVGLLVSLTTLEAEEIVKRYAKGGRCQILLRGEEPAGYAWISDCKIAGREKLLWQPEKSGDYCCYDICIYKKQSGDVLRQALACLAWQPLPGHGHKVDLIFRTCDRQLARVTEGLFREQKQEAAKTIFRENPNEI